MPRRYFSSTATETTLTAGVNNSDTLIQVATATGYPPLVPFTVVLDPDTANEELVEVTSVGGNVFTVTRGVDGTTAVSHALGAAVKHVATARDLREVNEHAFDTTRDDHTQYLTQARGDARYYTENEIDTNFYTKTAADAKYLTQALGDARYYTESEIDSNFYTKTAADARYLQPPGAATAYTPTLGASTPPTLGSGSVDSGRYFQLGKLVIVNGFIKFGSSGASAGSGDYTLSLPVNCYGSYQDNQVIGSALAWDHTTGYSCLITLHAISGDATKVRLKYDQGPSATNSAVGAASPWAWGASDWISFSLTYEAA